MPFESFVYNNSAPADNDAPYNIRYSVDWTLVADMARTHVRITGPLNIIIQRTRSDRRARWIGTGFGEFQLILFGQRIADKLTIGNKDNAFRFPIDLCNNIEATAVQVNIDISVPWNVAFDSATSITFILWEGGAPGRCNSPGHDGPIVNNGLFLPLLPEPELPQPGDPTCDEVAAPDCEHGDAIWVGMPPDNCWRCPDAPVEPSKPDCDDSECWIGPGLWHGTIASALGACPEGLDNIERMYRIAPGWTFT